MAEILAKFELIQLLLNELIPKLRDERKGAERGRLLIGSIQGNLIDFGKLMLKILFIASGFGVIDLGTDVSPETFAEHVRMEKPDVLAIAVYTKESLPMAAKTVQLLKQDCLRQDLKIMLGGWAVTPEFAAEAGADIFAVTAEEAVELCLAAVGT
nr:cobalamin-dependent protein [Phosphitispora fastidiosa]